MQQDDAIDAVVRDQHDRIARMPIDHIAQRRESPDQNILQKSRQILDELRRRAGERFRPSIELDYIERLLKRF